MKQLPFWAVFFSKNEAKSGFVFYQILPRDEAFSAFFCNFPSGLARPHNKIHGEKWKKSWHSRDHGRRRPPRFELKLEYILDNTLAMPWSARRSTKRRDANTRLTILMCFFCSSRPGASRVVHFLCSRVCFWLVFWLFYKGKIDTKFLSKNHASETETRSHR